MSIYPGEDLCQIQRGARGARGAGAPRVETGEAQNWTRDGPAAITVATGTVQ